MFAQPLKDIAPVTPLLVRLVPCVPHGPHLPGEATPRTSRRRTVLQPVVALLAVLTLVGGLGATALAQSSGNFAADLDTELRALLEGVMTRLIGHLPRSSRFLAQTARGLSDRPSPSPLP